MYKWNIPGYCIVSNPLFVLDKVKLHIEEYSFSQSTLEQVGLHI